MLEQLSPRRSKRSIPVVLIAGKRALLTWTSKQPQMVRKWVSVVGFKGTGRGICLIPNKDGTLRCVLAAVPELGAPWAISHLPAALPKGRYWVANELTPAQASSQALGWALGCYKFGRYRSTHTTWPELVWPEGADVDRVTALVQGIGLGRDLINTPAEDMGPEQLSIIAEGLAKRHSAKFTAIVGDSLLEKNYPMVHAVGRASTRAPRLIDFTWGDPKHPKVTLVGKGVCFDTGGLDLKPADNMKLMKKDMGGAAAVLGIASAVMQLGLPVRLRVLIPAVENSVSGNAFRPLDVLPTRKGVTVEVGHTDAEGRLVLCDALFEADQEKPDLLLDLATLTGAARVALGTSLPAVFASNRQTAAELLAAGLRADDPLWELPLHRAYRSMLDSKVADISNVASGGYAGAITAALFLQEFVARDRDWLHIDTMAFNLESRPGRPYGGEVFGLRAIVELLTTRYGL